MGAPSLLNYDPSAGETPPQAPAPVETLADFANVQAPSSTDALRTAAFGDKGAEQYANLAAAGQQRVAPGLAGLAGMAPAPTPASSGVMPSDFMNLIGDIASGAAGHPEAGQERAKMQAQVAAQQQSMQLAKEKEVRDNASEFYEKLMPSIFESFPGRPDLAASMLKNAAAQRNLVVDPTVLISLNQRMQDGQLPRDAVHQIISDPNTPIGVIARIGASAKGADDAIHAAAMADEAIASAQKTKAEAVAAPAKLNADAQKAALDIAYKIRQVGAQPSAADFATLDAAGMTAWPVPVAGVEGAQRWMTGPKGSAPPEARNIAGNLRKAEEQKIASTAQAKEHAVTTSSTRTMKEAAPKVTGLADKALASLDKTTTGPFAGRWKEIMAGKIGTKDPEFIRLRTELGLLSTLMMRMHVGARGSEGMLEHFKSMFADAAQSPENMRTALSVAKEYADMVKETKEGDEVKAPNYLGTEGAGAAAPATNVDSILKQYGY